jgi:TRAP-type C4-dicarboxylate transport system substrate-binding protein
LFDSFFPTNESKQIDLQKQEAQKDREFTRDQSLTQSVSNPKEDQVYEAQQQMRTDLLKWQQDLGDELVEIVMTLKGFAKTENNGWVKVRESPL